MTNNNAKSLVPQHGYLRVAGEAYNIELDLLPIELYIKLAATRSALRLLTTPTILGSERNSDSPLGKLSQN